MAQHKNSLGQQIGPPLTDWQPCERPPKTAMLGNYCRVEALNIEKHTEDLYHAFAKDIDHSNWTYLPYGPFDGVDGFGFSQIDLYPANGLVACSRGRRAV